jgi:two-component system, OmpR family, sensor histidine kinase QseC
MAARHSLVWRLLAAVLGSLVLAGVLIVWILAVSAWEPDTGDYDRELVAAARALADVLAAAHETRGAETAATIEAFLDDYERERTARQSIRFVVIRDGMAPFGSSWLSAYSLPTADGVAWLPGADKRYRVATRSSAGWVVHALGEREALNAVHTGVVLQDVAGYIGLAALVVVPLLAVAALWSLGSLRRLGTEIEQRVPEDLSPLTTRGGDKETSMVIAKINDLLQRTAHAAQRERNFMLDAAHDLRTPLATLVAQAQVLIDAADTSSRFDALVHIERSADRVARLSEQLLRLSQVEQAPLAPATPIDIVALVQDTLADFDRVAQQAGVEVVLAAPAQLLVRVERMPLLAMLENLLDNALRHGAQGGLVEVTVEVRPNDWILRVRDRGVGIAAGDRLMLFERFARGRSSKTPGTGLGLAIAAGACRKLQADLSLRSTPDIAGCEFSAVFRMACPGSQLPGDT